MEGRRSVPLATYAKPSFNFTERPFASPITSKYKILIKRKECSEKPPKTPSEIDVSLDTPSQNTPKNKTDTLYAQFQQVLPKPPSNIGLPAIKSFHKKFRNFNKTNQTDDANTVTSTYLKHLALINRSPQSMGIVKMNGISNEMNLK